MKNHKKTMKNHEKLWKTMKNQPGTMKTMKNHEKTVFHGFSNFRHFPSICLILPCSATGKTTSQMCSEYSSPDECDSELRWQRLGALCIVLQPFATQQSTYATPCYAIKCWGHSDILYFHGFHENAGFHIPGNSRKPGNPVIWEKSTFPWDLSWVCVV